MIYVFLGLSVILFMGGLKILNVVQRVRRVASESREAWLIIHSTMINDEEKEAIIQTASVKMLGTFFAILSCVGISLGLAVGWVILGVPFGLYSIEDVIFVTSDWYFICTSTLIMGIGWYIFK